MEKLQQYFNELAEVFGYKLDDSLFEYLKSISKQNNTVCGKEIIEGEGGWKCLDCEIDKYSLYCNDCFIKEKHKDHRIYYNPSVTGYCDCGDDSVIKPEGFCHKHKGDFDNIQDLMTFIKSSIPENLLNLINNILNNIFILFIDKIKVLLDSKDSNDEIYNMFDSLKNFCEKLSKTNLSLFYFVTLKFTENFPYETTHKCFNYNETNNLITFIKKDQEKKHTCICPFMQVMIYVLMKKNTKQNSTKFISLFLQTYKNKIITALTFLNTFAEMFYNNNLKSFIKTGYQIIRDFGILVYQDQNIPFLQDCFEDIYTTYELCFNQHNYQSLCSMSYYFYEMIKLLPEITIFDKINSNHKILEIIINICSISNSNQNALKRIFENNESEDIESEDSEYDSDLFEIEIYSLMAFSCLIKIINYDDKETINFLFKIIFEKLFEIKNYKESLQKKIFSPHMIILKYYTLILNRFCFNYSIKNKCDLYDSFTHFQNIFPQSKQLNLFFFEELIHFFCFIATQLESYENYFSNTYIMYKIDITLMKYLLSQKEIRELFTLQNIISLLNNESSNDCLGKILSEDLDDNKNLLDNIEENKMKYINSIIEYIYLIIRDSFSMETAAFRNTGLKLKIKDEIYQKLYQQEKDKIHTLKKNEIIHFILSNMNQITRDECIEYFVEIYDQDDLVLLEEVLKEDCEKISLSSGLNHFSLKKKILNTCDIDNLIILEQRENAIEYITNFQSKDLDIFKIKMIEPLNIQKQLTKNIYETFYNEKNMNDLVKLYNFIIKYKDKFPSMNQIFYYNIRKILTFSYKLCFSNLLDEDFKKELINKLNQIEDKKFMKQFGEKKDLNVEENNKKEKESLKEKLKQKFRKKNALIKEKIISLKLIPEEEIKEEGQNEEEVCVYCRQVLNKNPDNQEYYGKICYYFSDYLTDICRKIPEGKRKKNKKFVSCGHKMHFKCFNEFICLYLSKEKYEFKCPLCKNLSNFILFDFFSIIKNDVLKGINYDEENVDINEFYKKDKDDKYKSLLFFNILVFENYCKKMFKKEILIKDINGDKNLGKKVFELINNDFEEFTTYYTETNNKKDQIDIWKNIIYNLRLLFQYQILNIPDDFFKLLDLFENENIIDEEPMANYPISYIINELIIFSAILFEPTEVNKENIKNIFNLKFLLYIFYVAFIKSNYKTFEEFLYNKNEIEKLIELNNLKINIFLLLFNEKEENINQNFSLEEIILFIKTDPNIINEIKALEVKKNDLVTQIKDQYLGIPKLSFIDIPENGIEFCLKTNGNCLYCHQQNINSYFCLLCGNKICNYPQCIVEDKTKGKKQYSLIYHSKICNGGNGIFLNITNSEIVYLLKRRIIKSKIFVYLNDYGECLNIKYMNEKYELDNETYKKGIKVYIDMTFRKNLYKINNLFN